MGAAMTLLKAVETVMDLADFQDTGPFGEGWSSQELQAACDFLDGWVADQTGEPKTQR